MNTYISRVGSGILIFTEASITGRGEHKWLAKKFLFFKLTMVPLQQKNFYIYIYVSVNYLYKTLELENVNLIEKYADSCA